jgi:hypothetical protein
VCGPLTVSVQLKFIPARASEITRPSSVATIVPPRLGGLIVDFTFEPAVKDFEPGDTELPFRASTVTG